MINGLLKILYLFIILTLYHIKIVLSNVLDLRDISSSGFEVAQTHESGMIKTIVLSSPDRQITEVRQGRELVWMGHPGESVKCLTHTTFMRYKKALVTMEINNPVKHDVFYLYNYFSHYVYTSKDIYDEKFRKYSKPPKYLKKLIKPKADIDDTKNPKKIEKLGKHKGVVYDTEPPKKRGRSSKSKGDIDNTKKPKTPRKHNKKNDIVTNKKIRERKKKTDVSSQPVSSILSSEEREQEEPLDLSIKQKSKQPGSTEDQPLIPENIHIEISDSEDITEQLEPVDLSSKSGLQPETIRVELISDDEKIEELSKTTDQLIDSFGTLSEPLTHPPPTEPQSRVEMESNKDTQIEEPTEEQRKQQRKFLMERLRNKIQQRIQEKSKQSQVQPEPSIDLLNEPLFDEDVEKLLESELSSTGLSHTELDSILEGATEEN
ncbi:TpHN family protein [Theileria parva strain Muguga]|uniref:Tash1 protein, putative n=1 Tax=Theileria parva TaxID=5875 RepID=Q4N857_THEPA|nr:uncharacterized protein TpMuguga_01g00613 [Theileria parva strain Muguga]EAN33851.1 TpHN family protein [Theileria parva strain Muguga]|eukprot:XP_766134.1 hypothetical protein [Theileria parva strain Muguga]